MPSSQPLSPKSRNQYLYSARHRRQSRRSSSSSNSKTPLLPPRHRMHSAARTIYMQKALATAKTKRLRQPLRLCMYIAPLQYYSPGREREARGSDGGLFSVWLVVLPRKQPGRVDISYSSRASRATSPGSPSTRGGGSSSSNPMRARA